MIPGVDYFVRLIDLPIRVEAMVLPNNDATFDIYINSNLCKFQQEAALQHELKHLERDHLYSEDSVAQNEFEAG